MINIDGITYDFSRLSVEEIDDLIGTAEGDFEEAEVERRFYSLQMNGALIKGLHQKAKIAALLEARAKNSIAPSATRD